MSDAQQRIDELVKQNEILLFMKGSASFPMCGGSRTRWPSAMAFRSG